MTLIKRGFKNEHYQSQSLNLGHASIGTYVRGRQCDLTNFVTSEKHRGKGEGSRLMKLLTRWADIYKVRLSLTASAMANWEGALTQEQLVEFYKRHGFVELDDQWDETRRCIRMHRMPIGQAHNRRAE